jgi:hypothetical protein
LQSGLNIPQANGAISTASCERTTVTGEIKGIDMVLMSCKNMEELFRFGVPDLRFLLASDNNMIEIILP